jgi:hypothetical protein
MLYTIPAEEHVCRSSKYLPDEDYYDCDRLFVILNDICRLSMFACRDLVISSRVLPRPVS